MKNIIFAMIACLVMVSASTMSNDYVIDTKGMHAFIQFRVKHLGYSWLYGRFNEFSGQFSYDPATPDASKISIDINMASVDTNHAERDKHIRSEDFLNVSKYPMVSFVNHDYKEIGNRKALVTGDLTFNGATKAVALEVFHVGGGKDPWGGFRQGFEGRTVLRPAEFGLDIAKKLGPSAAEVELILSIEGVRK